jgi:hypothetical protein
MGYLNFVQPLLIPAPFDRRAESLAGTRRRYRPHRADHALGSRLGPRICILRFLTGGLSRAILVQFSYPVGHQRHFQQSLVKKSLGYATDV